MYADSETGLYYNGHRYYEPRIGRYISSDPIGLAGGLNTYSYAYNNPLVYIDPNGLSGIDTLYMDDKAPLVVLGRDIGALAAYANGSLTGDQSLVNTATEALEENRQTNIETLAVLMSMGRGRTADERICRVARAESRVWNSLKPWRGKTKTNGLTGKDRRYYEYDSTHGEIEVYNARGQHLGAMNAETGAMTKPAVPGRRIDVR